MEIDFRTAREALIYEIGIKTGIIQREIELQKQKSAAKNQRLIYRKQSPFIKDLQEKVDFTINVIKGI